MNPTNLEVWEFLQQKIIETKPDGDHGSTWRPWETIEVRKVGLFARCATTPLSANTNAEQQQAISEADF